MHLQVETVFEESEYTIMLKGLVDYSTIDQFSFHPPEQTSQITLDLSEVEFIDSTGIGTILSVIHYAGERQIGVEFEGLNDATQELFETLGVFKIMEALLRERC
ncbi:STAS domain-containing protein [Paenibacillus barcinonensis]|uniref:Anti-anti-sigma factor n=1 Tax=Paenibacillus barcinonensis TaxID=198119 RepID=A0A2V4VII9_PAEBA|nr:STAS domain-containing protein [Paenibacillus barcinonensis]PYE48828.1 anti-anti-sigma factor [Paenibacillus barcinonensis]QKS57746.1 STAS domain-containing protein [Paenibacillus barcinonensis]